MPLTYLKFPAFPAIVGTVFAVSLTAAPVPASAACNPDDCGGMSREALARDKAEIRRFNREQARYVKKRDAEYAKGWRARRQHKADLAEYDRRMAAWREAVRRCEAGDYRYCAR